MLKLGNSDFVPKPMFVKNHVAQKTGNLHGTLLNNKRKNVISSSNLHFNKSANNQRKDLHTNSIPSSISYSPMPKNLHSI